ncbi:sigma-54 dependent transcriptional regulator [bacterium]|nr:sigma-54 dependent transcriptional regulator [bacterium]
MNTRKEKNGNFFGIIGDTPQMQQVKAVIQQVAPANITVMISGESGTGKELVARAIHQLSHRSQKPLVTVNCGAIPEGIFESEVFGHVKGAFTSADRTRKGYFEMADSGTIFLDEIGEMPMEAQAKILRILELGEFMKVGSSASEKVDVRVIAATNIDLAEAVTIGEFRQDLYFRLKAVNIHLPPLRERKDDIALLAEQFIAEVCMANNLPKARLTPGGLTLLRNAFWEGNIRELKHFLESLVVLEPSDLIDEDLVSRHLRQSQTKSDFLPVHVPRKAGQIDFDLLLPLLLELKRDMGEIKMMLQRTGPSIPMSTGRWLSDHEIIPEDTQVSLEDLEREQIARTLREVRGNRRRAAETLGISERTLYRKIKEYGL